MSEYYRDGKFMSYTFEGEFGDLVITKRQCHITPSQAEENAWHVLLFDVEGDIRDRLMDPIGVGVVRVRHFVKVPPKCPNCEHELNFLGMGNYSLQETDCLEYKGATVEVIPSYDEQMVELLIRYEHGPK